MRRNALVDGQSAAEKTQLKAQLLAFLGDIARRQSGEVRHVYMRTVVQ